jgi:hypothetical protein
MSHLHCKITLNNIPTCLPVHNWLAGVLPAQGGA